MTTPTRTRRLTAQQRREAAIAYERGLATQDVLARAYGVSQKAIAQYVKAYREETGQPRPPRRAADPQRAEQRSEHQEQAALIQRCQWYANRYPELALLFAVPNGGLRSKATAAKLRAEGVKSGIPDLLLPVARQGYNGCFIEMKTAKGTTSEAQDWWLERLREQGYLAVVCKGQDAAWETITAYLGISE